MTAAGEPVRPLSSRRHTHGSSVTARPSPRGPGRNEWSAPHRARVGSTEGHAGPPESLRGALVALLDGGNIPSCVAPDIGASWQRSAAAGLSYNQVEVPFDPVIDVDGSLFCAARPVIDELASDLEGAPVGVLVADARGQVLYRRAALPGLGALPDSLKFATGFIFAEDRAGTNGIGMALMLRRPAMATGHEHFADGLTTEACAAAPVFDSRSARVLGAVGITSSARDASVFMMPFVKRAARDVERRLFDAAGVSERLMLRRFLRERRRAKGPLVLLTPHSMITNAAADGLIATDDETILRDLASRWLTRDTADESRVVLTRGILVTVRCEPLVEGGSPVGTMLRIAQVADVEERAQGRISSSRFGWESLTATECSVIELVAAGLTNREAAERLFLSHHTVGFHLRSIFAKLGLSSRVELARAAIERDTAQGTGARMLGAVSGGR
jgi:DNA-binding CsgD family transcriptional regulator